MRSSALFFASALAMALPASGLADLVEVPGLGVRLERGFRITQFSDERLADDIWCMTLNPRGEPVVSGPGYISTLQDTDGDGRADKALRFASIKSGAMGLCFDETGKQLLAMADGWLSEYRDENLDGVADGAPRKIAQFADGELGGHAIRRGPDGWWWVICGSAPPPDGGKEPRAGALLRFSPDFSRREVWADGFANPYDFDFNERGEVFTVDADAGRDYGLPWYSGCRAYQVQARRFYGWRTAGEDRGFRVPDYLPETAPALADLGRGAPAGVQIYHGAAFPPSYRGGLFVADWALGRLLHLPLVRDGQNYVTAPEVFLERTKGQGWTITDLVETKDGALLVSVGGRKTRSGVYRIDGPKNAETFPALPVLAHAKPPPPAILAELAEAQTQLGGWCLEQPSSEAFAPYEPAQPRGMSDAERKEAVGLAENALFSLDDRVVAEAARLLAMLADDSPRNAANLLNNVSPKTPPAVDFHFLACLARLRVPPDAERTARVAHIVLDLDRKLRADRHPKPRWNLRFNEVLAQLVAQDPSLPAALLADPQFPTAGQLPLATALPSESRAEALRRWLNTYLKLRL